MATLARLARRLVLPVAAVLTASCVPPGVTTVVEKGVNEARGGRGDLQEVTPLPNGNVLDRFRSARVLPVQTSPDSGPIPNTLPGVLETTLVNGIREANLFPGRGTPTLFIRVKVTTYWQDEGLLQVLRAYSEVLARVEFLEEKRPTALGSYYVRGFSTAIKRKSDTDLSAGLTSSVVDIIRQHRNAALKDK